MESLSRPFHRRKLSNANSFSGKNAYDGVFSGHRPKFDGVPAVHVDEYREIFSSGQAASSIPVLDLSTLQESSDGSNLEFGSTKPDYGKIFGGFRDEDIAVSYEELLARDKARAPMSTSQNSQDLGDDISHESFEALKQFNMSYKRSKDGLDGTTHVTQLHAVPGFTCFIDESASQPTKETKKQKSSIPNDIHTPQKQTSQTAVKSKSEHHQEESLSDDKKTDLKSYPSKKSSPKKEKEKKISDVRVDEVLEKQTSQSVQSQSKHHQKESLSDDKRTDLKTDSFKIPSPKKEIEKQKFPVRVDEVLEKQTAVESQSKHHQEESLSDDKRTDFKSQSSKISSPKKEIEKQKSHVRVDEVLEKQTSQTAVESQSKHHQEESLSDDKRTDFKSQSSKISSPKKEIEKPKIPVRVDDILEKQTLQSKNKHHQEESSIDDKRKDLKPHSSKISSPKKENEKKKSSVKVDDFLEKQTSEKTVETKFGQDESLSDDRFFKKFEADINFSFKGSSSPSTSKVNVDNQEDYQKRSTHGVFSSNCFDDEIDVNSVAGASTAALRKAIEKAQESIRIAKESVGRKKEGLKSFSSKSFKDSLKVKVRVEKVKTGEEEQREKDNRIKEIFKARVANVGTSQVLSESRDKEKIFGVKKVINEIHEKIMEPEKKSELPIESSLELKDDEIVCESKEVLSETKATMSFEEVENDMNESLKKDNERPNGFCVIESCENEIGDLRETIKDDKTIELKENKDEVGQSEESSNLTLCEKVEDEKKISHDCDQNDNEKKDNEVLELLENSKESVHEQEHNDEVESEKSDEQNKEDEVSEKVVEEKREVKEESEKEEDTNEKFYDVCDVEIIENSSSDYDDAEESVFHSANRIEIHTEEVDQVDYDVEWVKEVDDISDSSSQVTKDDTEKDVELIQEVDDVSTTSNEVIEEKELFENISSSEIASQESDEVSHCGIADVDIGQKEIELNNVQCESPLHGMEIEVKEYKESEETIKKQEKEEEEEEEIKVQESNQERPEIVFEMETGTSEESKNMNEESKESEPKKVVENEDQKRIEELSMEERERERNKLAVERAIREAYERAFNEARERAAVERANRENVQEKAAMKASDLITSKLKAERAAVERATSEARQRALEKAMSQKKVNEPKTQSIEVKQTSSDLNVANGTSTESALRSKAKLEKHIRIMERAAKALAEKEKRDQLAQKEQAERSRLAENLDADIKRWSTGKENNLRALLSTLQYILGAESGWQAVSLTEIITTSAVKKAYRKATLCVHPDKLQQRGASIQQKYICEKVFDRLKAAWNRFNSEER